MNVTDLTTASNWIVIKTLAYNFPTIFGLTLLGALSMGSWCVEMIFRLLQIILKIPDAPKARIPMRLFAIDLKNRNCGAEHYGAETFIEDGYLWLVDSDGNDVAGYPIDSVIGVYVDQKVAADN